LEDLDLARFAKKWLYSKLAATGAEIQYNPTLQMESDMIKRTMNNE